MILRAAAVWALLLVAAIANGALRELLADYNLAAGRVWVFVPVATQPAPAWALARISR